jgi:hypothetical protein
MEIDIGEGLWTITPERMKAGKAQSYTAQREDHRHPRG